MEYTKKEITEKCNEKERLLASLKEYLNTTSFKTPYERTVKSLKEKIARLEMSKKPTRYSLANIPYSVYDTIWLPRSIDLNERYKNIDFCGNSIGRLDQDSPFEIPPHKKEIDTNLYMPKALPSPQTFEVYNISISMPYNNYNKNKDDILLLMDNSYFILWVRNIRHAIFKWHMLDDVGGDYYYKGNYKFYSKLKIGMMELFYPSLVFDKSVKFSSNLEITASLDGILQREIR